MLAALQHSWVASLYRNGNLPVDGLRGSKDEARFAIYRASLAANLTQALAGTYPVIEKLVGEPFFGAAAKVYLREHPSRHGDIHALGEQFSAFIEHFEPACALPYLADVARLEWLAHLAFHAADCDALDLDRLAALSEAQLAELHVKLHPSLHLMQSSFPVHRIWQANQESTMAAPVDLGEGEVSLCIFRDGLEIALMPLDTADYTFVAALQDTDLAAACERVLQYHPAFDPGQALYFLFSQRLVIALSMGDSPCML